MTIPPDSPIRPRPFGDYGPTTVGAHRRDDPDPGPPAQAGACLPGRAVEPGRRENFYNGEYARDCCLDWA